MSVVKVISFGHPIPTDIKEHFSKSHPGAEFYEVAFNLVMTRALRPQIKAIIEKTLEEANIRCEGEAPFIILPGVSVATAMVVTMLYGALGRFPFVLELAKNQYPPYGYRLKEVHSLDDLRLLGRHSRLRDSPQEAC